jgi:hypothetical protein
MTLRRHTVRVSFAALVRIRDDDRYVLLHSPNRPGSYSPPGGVYKYFGPAIGILEKLGFCPDRSDLLADDMRADLRGVLPASSLRGFVRWFDGGAYRENPTECLRRELAEELIESGLPHLEPHTYRLDFSHVRTVLEGPRVSDKSLRQLRRLEVYDLVTADIVSEQLRRDLVQSAGDEAVSAVVCATPGQIMRGRSGTALIGGHAGYLIGTDRTLPDLPMVR